MVELEATQEELVLPTRPAVVIDVYFDDHRVLSAAPRECINRRRQFAYPWPPDLRRFLTGRTTLVVREHVTGNLIAEGEIAFDDTPKRVLIEDAQGRRLSLDKWNGLTPTFGAACGDERRALVETALSLMNDVREFGVEAFLNGGALLGAVRNGELIGHDSDIDIGYFSSATNVADVLFESFALERFLVARGWQMNRVRGSFIRARVSDPIRGQGWLDIFLSFQDGKKFYLDRCVWADLSVESVVPTRPIVLEGLAVPAPRDPGVLLEAIYGADYLIPDPAWHLKLSRSFKRRTVAWFGKTRVRRNDWRRRYETETETAPRRVSALARRLHVEVPRRLVVVDVGCGAGTDALWLASAGRVVVGLDFVEDFVERLAGQAANEELSAQFRRLSLYDLRACLATGTLLASEHGAEQLVMLCRNTLDVVEPDAVPNFWLFARAALAGGGRLYLEFRRELRGEDQLDPGIRPLRRTDVERQAIDSGARIVSCEDDGSRVVLTLDWM